MTQTNPADLQHAVATRFGQAPTVTPDCAENPVLQQLLMRGSCRNFTDTPVPQHMLDIACAAAMAAPTKSDLQQRDIILVRSKDLRAQLAELVSGQAWVAGAPMIAVFCGNNRRQRLLHDWHNIPFANDHLDALINATADAAIALGACVTAVEAMGLGCCPISALRNEPEKVSNLLGLPDHVFPFAGLAIGYPAAPPPISQRLPLTTTCHVDRYQENGLQSAVRSYDQRRAETQPYSNQRFTDQFGQSDSYGWSEDKVRQYSQPERAGFGAFIRRIGFNLE